MAFHIQPRWQNMASSSCISDLGCFVLNGKLPFEDVNFILCLAEPVVQTIKNWVYCCTDEDKIWHGCLKYPAMLSSDVDTFGGTSQIIKDYYTTVHVDIFI